MSFPRFKSRLEAFRNLIRRYQQRRELFEVIVGRDLSRVRQLLGLGLDLNFVKNGKSPLCQAVYGIRDGEPIDRRIVDLLIEHGASPQSEGDEHFLSVAARLGEHDLIDLALRAGLDIHYCPRNGTTALQTAVFRNKVETVKYLLSKGATKDDFYPACSWSRFNAPMINLLLDIGVEVPGDIAECVRDGRW